ncbi:MAG: hypothetical protein WBX30_05975 [Stellaceae bacterium]
MGPDEAAGAADARKARLRHGPGLLFPVAAAMDQAGVDRALIHPVLWDPDSNELVMGEAVCNWVGWRRPA